MNHIDLLKVNRDILVNLATSSLTDEQLLNIPNGFSNNVLWNMGHLMVTQQALNYKLSGLDSYVTEEDYSNFMIGTSPENWTSTPDIVRIKELLLELPNKLEMDYAAGRFVTYNTYTTKTNTTLSSIDDAIAFNNYHEGIHLGLIMALKKHL